MGRALLLVLDSVGCGAADDAGAYGDAGADTLGHIAEACAAGRADRAGVRAGPLHLPSLSARGLGLAAAASTGRLPPGLGKPLQPAGLWGYGVERAEGKDTPSGHWELAGAPALAPWGYFPMTAPSVPATLTDALCREGKLPGVIGNTHASGTAIIETLGAAHLATGKPIVYTSADSVLQIAAHETHFGLERLYDLCRIGRRLCDPLHIGRVIARPFVGDPATGFTRTANRRDFAMPPPPGGLLELAALAGRPIVTIGKIGDIFAHRFTGTEDKRGDNMAHFDATVAALESLPDGGLIFANFLDFDSDYGHRRDVAGYAASLEAFDRRLPELDALLRDGDLVVITADHGNDPTFPGTDHTREHVPILAYGPGTPAGPIGRRDSFADVGASVAAHLRLPATTAGRAWSPA